MLSIKERTDQNKKLAVIKCVKLLGQKNPENIIWEGNELFSHTNSRGRKRLFLPCLNYHEYSAKLKEHEHADMLKCLGYYVLYWDA